MPASQRSKVRSRTWRAVVLAMWAAHKRQRGGNGYETANERNNRALDELRKRLEGRGPDPDYEPLFGGGRAKN